MTFAETAFLAAQDARRHRAQSLCRFADGPVPRNDGLVNDFHLVHLGK